MLKGPERFACLTGDCVAVDDQGQGALNDILPETVKAEQHRKISEPGSANK